MSAGAFRQKGKVSLKEGRRRVSEVPVGGGSPQATEPHPHGIRFLQPHQSPQTIVYKGSLFIGRISRTLVYHGKPRTQAHKHKHSRGEAVSPGSPERFPCSSASRGPRTARPAGSSPNPRPQFILTQAHKHRQGETVTLLSQELGAPVPPGRQPELRQDGRPLVLLTPH